VQWDVTFSINWSKSSTQYFGAVFSDIICGKMNLFVANVKHSIRACLNVKVVNKQQSRKQSTYKNKGQSVKNKPEIIQHILIFSH
jgi:hypothetical protein